MKLHIIIFIMTLGVFLSGCGMVRVDNKPFVNTSSVPIFQIADTIVMQEWKVVNPRKRVHSALSFISSDTTIKDHKYSEWELLHMGNVYLGLFTSDKGLSSFLVDSIGIDTYCSFFWPCYLELETAEKKYCITLLVRADYYERCIRRRIHEDLIKPEYRSPFPLYRPGHKYEYYKMLVEISSEMYIDKIRNGSITIPRK